MTTHSRVAASRAWRSSTSSSSAGTGRRPSSEFTAPLVARSCPTSWKSRSRPCDPLPEERFQLFQVGTRSVHPDGYVEVEGAFNSAGADLEELEALFGQRV